MTGRAVGESRAVKPAELTVEDAERQQGLWWYLLLAGLVLLAAEMVVSNQLSRTERFLRCGRKVLAADDLRVVPAPARCILRERPHMSDGLSGSDRRQELIDVIRRVRNRWRLKLGAARRASSWSPARFAALFLSASGLEALRFTPSAIIAFRITAFVVFAALVYFGWIRPLRRRVTDCQVAMYLEEKDPSLQTAILSAVETSALPAARTGPSPKLVERLVEQAIDQCRAIDDGLAIERQGLAASPGDARRRGRGRSLSSSPSARRSCAGPLGAADRLAKRRGGQSVSDRRRARQHQDPARRRSDRHGQAARLHGERRDADVALVAWRAVRAGAARLPAIRAGSFEAMLFHVEKETTYFVESNGVRSPTFSMAVLDLPTVDQLVLEYHFPAYTGLEPRMIDPGGDIAAIQGTEVRLEGLADHGDAGRSRSAERDRHDAVSTASPTARSPASSRSRTRASTASSSTDRRARR